MEYPELKHAVRKQCEAFEAVWVLIQDNSWSTITHTALLTPARSFRPPLSCTSLRFGDLCWGHICGDIVA
jgi:hypothetical protein